MTKDEFNRKWDHFAYYSQDACNPTGLLYDAFESLCEWRRVEGVDDHYGRQCDHAKLMVYQAVYLMFGRELEWPEWERAYRGIRERMEVRHEHDAVYEHVGDGH